MNSCRRETSPGRAQPSASARFSSGLSLVCILLLSLTAGCAYRLGPTNGEWSGSRSVQVTPFVNKTIEPRLSDAVTTQVRKQIQRDGTYRLSSRDEGDIILTGTITDFERSGLSFQPTDVVTPRDYWIRMTARVSARERLTGNILFDRTVIGRTTMRVGADLVSAERQAAPLLAEDLARNITALLADGTW